MPHEIDKYASYLIRKKANQLLAGGQLPAYMDRDDVQSELMVHLLERLAQFDPTKGKWSTFVKTVICRKLRDLCARLQTAQSMAAQDLDGESPDSQRHRHLEVAEPTHEELVDLRLDQYAVVSSLSDEDQLLCAELSRSDTTTAAAKSLGCSRSHVYGRIRSFRAIMERQGLCDH